MGSILMPILQLREVRTGEIHEVQHLGEGFHKCSKSLILMLIFKDLGKDFVTKEHGGSILKHNVLSKRKLLLAINVIVGFLCLSSLNVWGHIMNYSL